MTERVRSNRAQNSTRYQHRYNNSVKMSDGDIGPRKSLFILVIVVGCFAVLWPKVFYPMLVGSANQHIKPNDLDKGCCDVISDTDVNIIKIMTELCKSIIQEEVKPLTGREIVAQCRTAVKDTCGIDISVVLQEQVRLGHTFKQILDEIRSLNGSLCLKYNFGLSPWALGIGHRVRINLSVGSVRQERPAHLRPEMLHPALKEKGRAIVQPTQVPKRRSTHKIVEGRPGPVPGVRPPMGGAGHVVPPSQKGASSMSVIMPIYTIAIVIFFTYTLMKVLFKKKPEVNGLYHTMSPDSNFRKEVFEAEKNSWAQRCSRNNSSKLGDEELDQLRRRLRDTELAMERIMAQMAQVPLKSQKDEMAPPATEQEEAEKASVKVVGMEMTASCEGGQKWSRPTSPVMPNSSPVPAEPAEPPQSIYLEGALPAQSQLLVADSSVEAQPNSGEYENVAADPPVVLASKMTLSVIGFEAGSQTRGIVDISSGDSVTANKNQLEIDCLDDENIEDSKYITASAATAAERDVSDQEEKTDDEIEMDEDIDLVDELNEMENARNGVVDGQSDEHEEVEEEIEYIEIEEDEDEEQLEDESEPQPHPVGGQENNVSRSDSHTDKLNERTDELDSGEMEQAKHVNAKVSEEEIEKVVTQGAKLLEMQNSGAAEREEMYSGFQFGNIGEMIIIDDDKKERKDDGAPAESLVYDIGDVLIIEEGQDVSAAPSGDDPKPTADEEIRPDVVQQEP